MRRALAADEIEGILVAVHSTFRKLRNCYEAVSPVFVRYGFDLPTKGVIARDLSEKIEVAITQHCPSFTKGVRHNDLARGGERWEVKVCKNSGLTINQSSVIAGEHYIVANYRADLTVCRVWLLRCAADGFFSPRKANSNARALLLRLADPNVEVLYETLAGRSARALRAAPVEVLAMVDDVRASDRSSAGRS